MRINRHNFESYYIDYIDGHLSPSEQEEMRTFLLLNDDLKEKTEGLEKLKLKAAPQPYPYKNILKKNELQAIPDYTAIAMAENNFTTEGIHISPYSPEIQHLAKLYQKLKLKPDYKIVYPNKNSLYRPNRHLIVFYKLTAIAALFVLLAGVYQLLFPVLPPAQQTISKMYLPEFPSVPSVKEPLPLPISPKSGHHIQKPVVATKQIFAGNPIKNSIPVLTKGFEPLSLEIGKPGIDYELILPFYTDKVMIQPEITLTETAVLWKASVNRIQSENIFSTMIHAGRIIAEKIRNNEDNK